MQLLCEHDNTKLKEEQTKAGTIYLCKKCGCKYRLTIAVNNNECWNKRFPPKPQTPKKELRSNKKGRRKT